MFLLSACETKPVSEFQSDFTKELNTEAFDEMIDYARCQGAAMDVYMDCIGK